MTAAYDGPNCLGFYEWLKDDFTLKKPKDLERLTSKEIEKLYTQEYKEYLEYMAEFDRRRKDIN